MPLRLTTHQDTAQSSPHQADHPSKNHVPYPASPGTKQAIFEQKQCRSKSHTRLKPHSSTHRDDPRSVFVKTASRNRRQNLVQKRRQIPPPTTQGSSNELAEGTKDIGKNHRTHNHSHRSGHNRKSTGINSARIGFGRQNGIQAHDLFVDTDKTLINLFKPLINLLKPLVNLLKPLVNLLKTNIHLIAHSLNHRFERLKLILRHHNISPSIVENIT